MLTINNTLDGAIQDIEIKGNTVQDPNNLADIKSVGVLQEDGKYKMSILSCGKNLLNVDFIKGNYTTGNTDVARCHTKTFIRLKKNTDYYLTVPTEYRLMAVAVDENNIYNSINISSGYATSHKFNTGNYSLIGFQGMKADGSTIDLDVLNKSLIQLEEGTVATSYEAYQGNKCDILLPCQLEKVGDVSDRLFKREDGIWCIEKNIETHICDGTETAYTGTTFTSYKTMYMEFSNILNIESSKIGVICDKLQGNTLSIIQQDNFIEGVAVHSSLNRIYFKLENSKATSVSVFKEYVKGLEVKYALATPKIIELPLDVQIRLNSFNGVTNIFTEDTIIEPVIKCTIPKSLGASVNSLVNKTDILSDRIEAIEGLKESQNMKYETDKGYLVCKETKNGTIDDLKLEGRTLVNLLGSKSKVLQNASTVYSLNHNITYTPNNIYTIIFYSDATSSNVFLQEQTYSAIWLTNIKVGVTKGLNIIKFTSTSNTTVSSIRFSTDASFSGTVNITDLILLEGDHTQNPPSYFEGLMSVGEDVDEIEVLSRKEDGNLFDGYWEIVNTHSAQSKNYVLLLKGKSYKIKTDYSSNLSQINFKAYSKKLEFLGDVGFGFGTKISGEFIPTENCYVKIFADLDSKSSEFTKANWTIQSSKSINENKFNSYSQDKKQILFYNSNGELEPVTELHEWDSIEKHSDNKWYYHKRSGEVVLDGDNYSINHVRTLSNVIGFDILNIPNSKYGGKSVNSHFISEVNASIDKEGLRLVGDSNKIICHINQSRLNSQNALGFKQWLQENPVTVVYQLAEEEVYELAPLHLDSYANETLILCNSGAISPRMEFSITSHINELVKAYGERVNLLEEKVYEYMVAQNRLQLASTYSADSVTFKVDYALCSEGEEEYNNDLYELILNNILVGKNNYDYDKMFNIILDYASWNQISWEQFDILVGLMDMQHNPPVEDIIEEDVIEGETPTL